MKPIFKPKYELRYKLEGRKLYGVFATFDNLYDAKEKCREFNDDYDYERYFICRVRRDVI